jgi:maltose O-acetyltransferase
MTYGESSENGKMLAGQPYDASDPELVHLRIRARRLTRRYNASREDEEERRASLLAELLGDVETGVLVEPPFSCDDGTHIHIGR